MNIHGSDDDQQVLNINTHLQLTTPKFDQPNSKLQTKERQYPKPIVVVVLCRNLGLENVWFCMTIKFFIFLWTLILVVDVIWTFLHNVSNRFHSHPIQSRVKICPCFNCWHLFHKVKHVWLLGWEVFVLDFFQQVDPLHLGELILVIPWSNHMI
jgi:hypothetical protein